jgi:hypothetical protein
MRGAFEDLPRYPTLAAARERVTAAMRHLDQMYPAQMEFGRRVSLDSDFWRDYGPELEMHKLTKAGLITAAVTYLCRDADTETTTRELHRSSNILPDGLNHKSIRGPDPA